MKLKEFNRDNCTSNKLDSMTAGIHMHANGCVTVNAKTAILMELSNDDQLVFYQDEEDDANWYVSKVKEKGFVLRAKKDSDNLVFSSTKLVKFIFDSVAFNGKAGKCLLGNIPTKTNSSVIYGLITSYLRNK